MIRKFQIAKKIFCFVGIFKILVFVTGCGNFNNYYENEKIVDQKINSRDYNDENNSIQEIEHNFFGVWRLERIVFSGRSTKPNAYSYVILVDVEEFLGEELEFTDAFVRLGERKLLAPVYHILQLPTSAPESFSYVISMDWEWDTENYYDPDEGYLRIFDGEEITLNFCENDAKTVCFERVSISYPEYLARWWRGNLMDPHLYHENLGFNPLFLSFFLLSEDYMLAAYGGGGVGGKVILARRIR